MSSFLVAMVTSVTGYRSDLAGQWRRIADRWIPSSGALVLVRVMSAFGF